MNFKKLSTCATVALGMALLSTLAANANVILTYTGNDFNTFNRKLCSPGQPYTGTDMVTASITLANPLGDNLNLAPVTPLAFSLNDDLQTITDTTPLQKETLFSFSTNASGTIVAWIVSSILTTGNQIQTHNTSLGTEDNAFSLNGAADAFIDSDPGSWTVMTIAAAPEPPTVTVLGAGLLGLGLFWWRRRQKLDLAQ